MPVLTLIADRLSLLAVGCAVLVACSGDRTATQFRGVALPTPLAKPSITLTDLNGQPYDFAGATRDKVALLFFGYTHCPDVCPLTMATLGEAVRLLGDDGERVQGVFVTVDPRHDKPKALTQYVRSFHEGFLALYGNKAETARTAGEFRVEPGEHHSTPVFLIDPGGRLRLVARPETSADSIAHDIRALLRG